MSTFLRHIKSGWTCFRPSAETHRAIAKGFSVTRQFGGEKLTRRQEVWLTPCNQLPVLVVQAAFCQKLPENRENFTKIVTYIDVNLRKNRQKEKINQKTKTSGDSAGRMAGLSVSSVPGTRMSA
tara:strand:- start:1236 stop:1607 length:372 start_codon:yes stop_codon:yes gene_type:complete